MSLKLGKQPAQPQPKAFKWTDLGATVELPTVPSRFGHANLFVDWGMCGNGPDPTVRPGFQGAGDCVFAGADHEHKMINRVVHRRTVEFDGATAIADYSAVTGYVVGDDSTDEGTLVADALSYRRKVGVIDVKGQRHKIGAYVQLDPTNWLHLLQATYIFGMVGIGFEFPASAWDQFNAGYPWDVMADDGGDEGGHYVPVMGTPRRDAVGTVSWGVRQEMTRAFYEKYNDESWVYITEEELSGTTPHGLHGFDVEKLNSYLAALKK